MTGENIRFNIILESKTPWDNKPDLKVDGASTSTNTSAEDRFCLHAPHGPERDYSDALIQPFTGRTVFSIPVGNGNEKSGRGGSVRCFAYARSQVRIPLLPPRRDLGQVPHS